MAESELLRRLMLAISKNVAGVVFRNQVGMGWHGQSERVARHDVVSVAPGDVVIRQARPLRAGLCVGSSDLIGWRSVEITPEMVGRRIAVFVAVEAKDGRGRATTEQDNFLDQVETAGGISVLARDAEIAVQEIKEWRA